jgi:hypothetical protein
LLSALVVAAAGSLAVPAPQLAAAPSRSDSLTYRVKECFDSWGWGRIPLRYGTRESFGYRHIKARRGYTSRTRRTIRRVLVHYSTYEPQGDSIVFRRYRPGKLETVVVGFNLIPNARVDSQIVGIVTAYWGRWKDEDGKRGNLPPNGQDPSDMSRCSG